MVRKKPAAKSASVSTVGQAEKMLSVRLPEDRHKALKVACVSEGVSIRSVLMALISEVEADSKISRELFQAAASSGD